MELDNDLDDEGVDAFFAIGDESDSDVFYLTGFETIDRSYAVLRRSERTAMLTFSSLDADAAAGRATVETIRDVSDYDFREKAADQGYRAAYVHVMGEFLDERGVERVGIPGDFPHRMAESLSEAGYDLTILSRALDDDRRRKSDRELDHLAMAQSAAEAALSDVEALLRDSTVRADGTLAAEGETVTSERVKRRLRVELAKRDCHHVPEPWVVCGTDICDLSDRGGGPLVADQPIVIKFAPRHESKYHGNLTRTFVVGTVPDELAAMHEATRSAQQAALAALEAGDGVRAGRIHEAICDAYEAAGYDTPCDGVADSGFVLPASAHHTGLDVHEPPMIDENAGELRAGNVVAIEPGLNDPDLGGTYLEDVVEITEDGYENLTSYHTSLT